MAAQRGLDFLLRRATTGLTATVNATTDLWTTSAHGWVDGQAVLVSTNGTLPASSPSIAANTIYYIDVQSSTTFSLHVSYDAAIAGTGDIDFSNTGSGTHTISPITTLAGMRSTSWTLGNEAVDVTSKDSAGARTLLAAAGTQALTINAAGVFTDSAVEELIRGYAFARSIDMFHLFLPNRDTITGNFQISNYERAGEFNGEETYSLTLESSGPLTYTAAP